MNEESITPTKHNYDWTAISLAAITAMAWGMTGVFVRMLPPIHPAYITAARLLIALPAAGLPAFLFRSRQSRCRDTLLRPESYLLASLLAGYYLMATTAFQMAPVAEVALLVSTAPLFVLLIERILGEPPSKAAIRGVILAVSGIAVIMSPSISLAGNATAQNFIGGTLALCAAFITATYAHLYQRLAHKNIFPDARIVTFLTFLVGGAGSSLIAAMQPASPNIDLDFHTITIFLALGILSTAVPTLGFAVVSNHLPAIMTATIALFIPLFSGIFAYLLLDERITPLFLIGSVLVLWGVSMIIFQNRS